jgi:hypothetical protein
MTIAGMILPDWATRRISCQYSIAAIVLIGPYQPASIHQLPAIGGRTAIEKEIVVIGFHAGQGKVKG